MTSPVIIAENLSLPMAIANANIAATNATLMIVSAGSVSIVDDAYRAKLEGYLASMAQAKRMLAMGILTSENYAQIDTIMAEKHGVSSCSLYRGIDLIYSRVRGNMSHYEEVTRCPE